jgi:3' exoribonuclease, RNase T-like
MSSSEPVHIMVDIETLDTQPSAIILSVGACVISPNRFRPQFYGELSVLHQHNLGRTTSQDTLDWWSAQSNCPKHGTFLLGETLQEFSRWIAACTSDPVIWCKGTDFDVAILGHAYKMCQVPIPWKYNSVRDFRTVKKLFSESVSPDIVNTAAHNALADAQYQTDQLLSIDLALK